MQKCCVFCFAKNKDAALTFCLQNVRKRQNAFWRTFSKGKCSAVQKCIFASHFPLENVQRTFSFGKCSANQNVRKRAAQKTPNTAFDAKMYL